MVRRLVVVGLFVMLVTACGGGDDDAEETSTGGADTAAGEVAENPGDGDGDGAGTTEVVDAPAAGMAVVSVDGLDVSFDTVGPVGCSVSDSEITVGFILPDNEVTFLAGLTASESGWLGRIDVNVQNSDGFTSYFVDFATGAGDIAVSGSSFSYSGDWEVFRSGASESEPAGAGTISASC